MATAPPESDRPADALEPEGEWNACLQAISGFISGAGLEHISVADCTAYDAASTGCNWHVPAGYGTAIAASPQPASRQNDTRIPPSGFCPNGHR